MARLFDRASSQYLDNANAPVTAVPLTLVSWFYATGLSDYNRAFILALSDAADAGIDFDMRITRAGAAYLLNAVVRYGGDSTSASTNGWTDSVWHHGAAVFSSNTSRIVYLNGVAGTENTDDKTPPGIDTTYIGAHYNYSVKDFFPGALAETAIYNVALTPAEVASLAKGISPRSVRPESLVFYAPLWRDEDEDFVGGLSLTAVNTPTVAAHPRVFYLATPQVGKTAAAGGSPSASESASESASGSASLSPSASESASESASINPSVSESASASASGSASASASESTSGSASGSASSSASGSASGSASPSPSPVAISVVWGHDTDVIEDTVRDFENNWTGTGTIENAGVSDTERLALDAEEYMISEIADTGAVNIVIGYNTYTEGDIIDLDYRHGATPTACEEAAWNNYTGQFTSLGYVQIRVTNA